MTEDEGMRALKRAVAAQRAMKTARDILATEMQIRRGAITVALAHGVGLDVIAAELGVSRERVRQIAAEKAPTTD